MKKIKENVMHLVFLAAACASVLAVALICFFLPSRPAHPWRRGCCHYPASGSTDRR